MAYFGVSWSVFKFLLTMKSFSFGFGFEKDSLSIMIYYSDSRLLAMGFTNNCLSLLFLFSFWCVTCIKSVDKFIDGTYFLLSCCLIFNISLPLLLSGYLILRDFILIIAFSEDNDGRSFWINTWSNLLSVDPSKFYFIITEHFFKMGIVVLFLVLVGWLLSATWWSPPTPIILIFFGTLLVATLIFALCDEFILITFQKSN